MAAAVTLLGTTTFTTASGTKTVTAAPAVGDLIVIVTAHSGNTSDAAPTDNNPDGLGTYTAVETRSKAASADKMKLWIRNARIGNASSTVFTHAPGASSGGGLAVMKVTGMLKTGAAAKNKSGGQDNQAAATPAASWTGGGSGTAAFPKISAVFNATNPAGLTKPATFDTERTDVGYNTPSTGLEVVSDDTGNTDSTVTWGSASASAFASAILELNAAVIASLAEQFTLGIATAGKRIRRGTVTSPFTVSVASAGARKTFGASTVPLALGIVAAGTARRTGRSELALTLERQSVGRVGVKSTATLGLSASISTAGFAVKRGTSTTDLVLTVGSVGRVGAQASSSTPLLVSVTTVGRRTTFSTATLPLNLAIFTNGTVPGGGPATHFGSATLGLSLLITAAGYKTTFASAAVLIQLLATVNGTHTGLGKATLPIVLTITTASASGGQATVTLDEIAAGHIDFGRRGHLELADTGRINTGSR